MACHRSLLSEFRACPLVHGRHEIENFLGHFGGVFIVQLNAREVVKASKFLQCMYTFSEVGLYMNTVFPMDTGAKYTMCLVILQRVVT